MTTRTRAALFNAKFFFHCMFPDRAEREQYRR